MAGGNFVVVVDTHGLEREMRDTARTFHEVMLSSIDTFTADITREAQVAAPKRGEFRRIGNTRGWSQLRLRRKSYKAGNLARATEAEAAQLFLRTGPRAVGRVTVRKRDAPYAPFVILGAGEKTVRGPRSLRFPETRPWRSDRGRTWRFEPGRTLRGIEPNDYMLRGMRRAVAAGRLEVAEQRLAKHIADLQTI